MSFNPAWYILRTLFNSLLNNKFPFEIAVSFGCNILGRREPGVVRGPACEL